jgi:fumarate hydratase, class II
VAAGLPVRPRLSRRPRAPLPGSGEEVAQQIAQLTGAPFVTAPNKFTAQGTLDRMMRAHAGLKATAVTLYKIANDLR